MKYTFDQIERGEATDYKAWLYASNITITPEQAITIMEKLGEQIARSELRNRLTLSTEVIECCNDTAFQAAMLGMGFIALKDEGNNYRFHGLRKENPGTSLYGLLFILDYLEEGEIRILGEDKKHWTYTATKKMTEVVRDTLSDTEFQVIQLPSSMDDKAEKIRKDYEILNPEIANRPEDTGLATQCQIRISPVQAKKMGEAIYEHILSGSTKWNVIDEEDPSLLTAYLERFLFENRCERLCENITLPQDASCDFEAIMAYLGFITENKGDYYEIVDFCGYGYDGKFLTMGSFHKVFGKLSQCFTNGIFELWFSNESIVTFNLTDKKFSNGKVKRFKDFMPHIKRVKGNIPYYNELFEKYGYTRRYV